MEDSRTFTFNIKAVANMKDVFSNVENIQAALGKLKLPNSLQTSFNKTFTSLTKEIEKYQQILNKPNKTKSDVTGLEKSGAKIITLYDQIANKIKSIDNSTLKNAFKDMGEEHVKNLRNEITQLQNQLGSLSKSNNFTNNLKSSFDQIRTELKGAGNDAEALAKKLAGSTFKTFLNNLDTGRLDLAGKNLNTIKQAIDNLQNSAEKDKLKTWIGEIKTKFDTLSNSPAIQELITKLQTLKSQLSGSQAQFVQELIQQFQNGIPAVDEFGRKMKTLEEGTRKATAEQVHFNSELDQVKSRIQYFFGLNNAINLVKRALRKTFNTVKELDAAMTETAVVTDFSVGDMWKQLPEYTKRAKELGITTLDAYKAATLYYQQGLKTNEVNAMSVETLKMARIAGLDAAEATDRMTNAVRGFNMEINTTNAQRIDDVYSKLAATSASNVDEISTAMTKVASLANNANMEFETTAAFLAQIIETTRESAETAGTALKTVVARFSEVKGLYTKGQLSGEDEEGEVIDVNRVAKALRTAGVDLNKYFIGEVGLDDIFMELASKWDSLTTLQQRYIATQAAGSRQQSRFIALMSDYGRMQELVANAYNAQGASAKQFEKTQDSLRSKLARLKDAWDQFLMGLANSSIIKGVVDGLTGLINGVNKLTEVLGTNIGTIAKWGVAVGTITAARKLLGITSIGIAGKGLLGKLGVGAAAAGAAGVGGAATGTIPIGSLLLGKTAGTLKYIGGGAAGGIAGGIKGLIAGTGIKAGAAAGAAGGALSGVFTTGAAGILPLAGGIAAVATAAYTAYKIIKALYNLTPTGQLKAAQKLAKSLKEQADEANETAKSFKTVSDNYTEQTKAIETSSTVSERNSAIKDRNEMLLAAVKENAELKKYIETTVIDGQLVLTLKNENEFLDKVKATAEASLQATIYASTAAAQANYKELQMYQYTNPEKYSQAAFDFQQNLASAYNNALKDSSLSDTLKDSFINSLITYSQDTGTILSSGVLQILANNVGSNTSFQALFNALGAEKFDFDSTKLSENELYNKLGFNDDTITAFSELLPEGIRLDVDALKKEAKARLNNVKVLQNEAKTRVLARLNEGQQAQLNTIAEKNFNRVFDIDDLISSFTKDINESTQNSILNTLLNPDLAEEDFQSIISFAKSIDFSEPINALAQLNKAAGSSSTEIQKLAKQVLNLNPALKENSNLIQSFFVSEDYNNILADIQDLINTNGSLGAADIETLSQKSSQLKTLLHQTDIGAQALAKSLELVAQGKISFEQINDTVLDVFQNTYSFERLVSDVSEAIKNFDAGTDYGEGVDFLTSQVEELQKLVDNFEFGNARTRNIYDLIFGEGSYDALLQSGNTNQIRENIKTFYELLQNDAYNYFNDSTVSGSLGIQNLGNQILEWDFSEIGSYAELIEKVQTASKDLGFELSETAAKALVTSYVSHSGDIDTINKLNELTIDELINETKKTGVVTDADVKAYAAAYGKSAQEIIDILSKAGLKFYDTSNEGFFGKDVTYAQDEDIFNALFPGLESPEDLKKRLGSYIQVLDEGFSFDISSYRSKLEQQGYSDTIINPILDSIQKELRQITSDKYIETTDISLDNLGVTIASISGVSVAEGVDIAGKIKEQMPNATEADITSLNVLLNNLNNEHIKFNDENGQPVDISSKLGEALTSIANGVPVPVAIKNILAQVTPETGYAAGTLSQFALWAKTAGLLTISQATATIQEITFDYAKDKKIDSSNKSDLQQDFKNYIYSSAGIDENGNFKLDDLENITVTLTGILFGLDKARQENEIDQDTYTSYYKIITQEVDKCNEKLKSDSQTLSKRIAIAPSGIFTIDFSKYGFDTNVYDELYKRVQAYFDILSGVYDDFENYYDSQEHKFSLEGFDLTGDDADKLYDFLRTQNKNEAASFILHAGLDLDKESVKQVEQDLQGLLTQTVTVYTELDEASAIKAYHQQKELGKHDTYEEYEAAWKGGAANELYDKYKTIFNTKEVSELSNVPEDILSFVIDNWSLLIGKAGKQANENVENINWLYQFSKDMGKPLNYEQIVTNFEELSKYIPSLDKLSIFAESLTKTYFPKEGEPVNLFGADYSQLMQHFTVAMDEGVTKFDENSEIVGVLTETFGLTAEEALNFANSVLEAGNKNAETIDNAAEAATTFANILIQKSQELAKIKFTSIIGSIFGSKTDSEASGGYISKPTTSLLAEEDPEIVWNKEKGYSYIVKDTQFGQLQPGDQVFNAQDTKKILRNSKRTLFASNAGAEDRLYAQWPTGNNSGSGGGSGNSNSDKKPTEWKNELDWLYNLLEDIVELERQQTKLEDKYEQYLIDDTKTGQDLYDVVVQRLANFYTQLDHQTLALQKREQEMREFMDANSEYSNYLWYNWNDRTLEIDWDAIEALQDKDEYDKISKLVSSAEKIQNEMDKADDSIMDIRKKIQELEDIWRDTFIDFEKRIFDALVKSYQRVIDNYSELNNTLNSSNQSILNSLQQQIQLERQIRDNTRTEDELYDQESRLAFLRRDTTGGNDLAALQLERELTDQRQSYEDSLIDQAISRLQDDNTQAQEQRERQIEMMQAQLDYQSENGEFNTAVLELLQSAMGADGELLTNSELVNLLKEQDNWDAMSAASQEVWEEELNTKFKESIAYLLKENAEENGTYMQSVSAAIQGITAAISNYSQAALKYDYGSSSGGSSGGGSGSSGSGGYTGSSTKPDKTSASSEREVYTYQTPNGGGAALSYELARQNVINAVIRDNPTNANAVMGRYLSTIKKKYATGGLNTKTGPAWLDGTLSAPEYVLNAAQTQAFLKLADILPAVVNGNSTTNNTLGNTTVSLVMNVESIGSDYDVDRLADRVKSIIYDAGTYRNVNSLNFLR